MAELAQQGNNSRIRSQGSAHARNIQTEVRRLDPPMSEESYGLKISTILNAVTKLTQDLDYLCSLVEQPDPEFPIRDAIVYTSAIGALANQLEFVLEDLAENDLNEDETHVRLSTEEIMMLHTYTESAEEALGLLEKRCGISLKNN